MKSWFKLLINAILPARCLLCGKVVHEDNSLCSECFEQISFITKPYCQHCGMPLDGKISDDMYCVHCLNEKHIFRYARSAIKYDEYSKKLMLDFKFYDHIENRILLSKWLNLAGRDIFKEGVDLIIPVPLHFTRMFVRKYNQSAILARELSKQTGVKAEYKVLVKTKKTIPQVMCDSKQRMKNVKNAFAVKNFDLIKGKRIVLIDDVFTTGATLKECAKTLKKAGAKSVDALTVARVC